MTTKPSKYRHGRFHWHDDDLFPNCNKKIVTCKFGYKGHLTTHLNQNIYRIVGKNRHLQVIKYIAHSHFSHETDLGRHLLCEVGRSYVDAEYCTLEYVLHKKTLPSWLRRELYGE